MALNSHGRRGVKPVSTTNVSMPVIFMRLPPGCALYRRAPALDKAERAGQSLGTISVARRRAPGEEDLCGYPRSR
jgi:hypothetical protein